MNEAMGIQGPPAVHLWRRQPARRCPWCRRRPALDSRSPHENFLPARVGVTSFEGYGDALTLDGMTLYGGYAFEKRWGGRNLRDTFTNVYSKGKKWGRCRLRRY